MAKSTFVTAAPFGFGNDLDSWSNHISKIDVSYDLSNHWRAHGNLQYLWGYPGTEDQVNFRNSTRATNAKFTDPGFDDSFKKSVFLNLGLEYKPSDKVTLNLVGYHLLGLIDKDLNKQTISVDLVVTATWHPVLASMQRGNSEESIHLNMGLEYHPGKTTMVRLDGLIC
ncbi:MAG TPA: hypothetical protein EYQ42_06795 [Thiotrichaceae bacterium]|nr:hypothetical protein [Thiotrichaceae bacterium]